VAMKQLSFADNEEDKRRKSWEELLPHSQVFLRGIHPNSPPPPKEENSILKMLRLLKEEQRERFAPAKRLGE